MDVISLLAPVVIMVAGARENMVGTALLSKVAAENPTVGKACVDAGFKDRVATHGATPGLDVQVVSQPSGKRGLRPLPKRRVLIQTQGTLIPGRCPVRDREKNPATCHRLVTGQLRRMR